MKNGSSLRIVLIYAIVGSIYIYGSDHILDLLTQNDVTLTRWQTYKGMGFMLLTSLMLYVLIRRHTQVILRSHKAIGQEREKSDTEKKRLEDEYWRLYNLSPLPLWIVDNETLVVQMVNDTACKIYGYTREEFEGMHLEDMRPEEDIELLYRSIEQYSQSSNNKFPWSFRHRKKNGTIIHVKIEYNMIEYKGRKARLVVATDISSELKMQDALIESNGRLQTACELAQLGYWTYDVVTGEINWSKELYQIFERRAGTFELKLSTIRDAFHPDDLGPAEPERAYVEGAMNQERESRIFTPTGKMKWILQRNQAYRGVNGKVVRIEGIIVDITKRKTDQHEIEQSNERFKMVMNATAEAIIDWDILNHKVYWGNGMKELFGYDLGIDDGEKWVEHIYEPDRQQVLAFITASIKDTDMEKFYAEFRYIKADDNVAHVQLRGILVRDQRGWATRAVGAMADVTETMSRISRIEEQNHALREVAWMQSHVIRAPLANIIGLVDLLRYKDDAGMSQDTIVEYLRESCDKLDRVIKDTVRRAELLDKNAGNN